MILQWSRETRRQRKKTNMQIFEIREKTYALGSKNKKAKAVTVWSKRHNRYIGVRGVKPTIPSDLKPATGVSDAVKEALKRLAN